MYTHTLRTLYTYYTYLYLCLCIYLSFSAERARTMRILESRSCLFCPGSAGGISSATVAERERDISLLYIRAIRTVIYIILSRAAVRITSFSRDARAFSCVFASPCRCTRFGVVVAREKKTRTRQTRSVVRQVYIITAGGARANIIKITLADEEKHSQK